MSRASLPRVRPASGQADPGEADDAGALMITLTGDPAQGAIDGRRGARHGLTGSAPPSSTVLQPLLPRVRLRAPRLPDRGLSRRPPPAGAGSVVNRCGGGWSAVALRAPRDCRTGGCRAVRPQLAREAWSTGAEVARRGRRAVRPRESPVRDAVACPGGERRVELADERRRAPSTPSGRALRHGT